MTSFPHSLPKQSILGNTNQFRLFPHAAKIVFYNWKCKISKCFGLAELLFCSMRNPIRPINGRPIATCIDDFLYQCQDFLALPVYAQALTSVTTEWASRTACSVSRSARGHSWNNSSALALDSTCSSIFCIRHETNRARTRKPMSSRDYCGQLIASIVPE